MMHNCREFMCSNCGVWVAILLVVAATNGTMADEVVPPPFRPDRQFDQAQEHFDLGMQRLNQDNVAGALEPLEQAVRARPDDIEFRCAWATALLRSRKPGAAWHVFDPVVRGDDTDPAVLELRLMIWQALGAAGSFNVGASADAVKNLLGEPDRQETLGTQTRWHYHFMAVNIENGVVHSVVDTRGYRPALPDSSHTMNLVLDGRPWVVGHRVVNERQATVDYVLQGTTVQQWQELLSVQQLYELPLEGISPKQWMENLRAPYADIRPAVEWEILEELDDRIIFFWSVPGLPDGQTQQEVSAILAGPRDLHRVTFIRRENPIPADEQREWVRRFERVTLVPPEGSAEVKSAGANGARSRWSRYQIWYLGRQLALIVSLRQQEAPPEMIETLLSHLDHAGNDFVLSLDPLPAATESARQSGAAEQRVLLEWAIRKVAPELSRAIARQQSPQDARLFETAMNCHLLTEVYRPNAKSAEAVRKVVERSATDSGLKESLWRPVTDALAQNEPIEKIGPLVQQLHNSVIRELESE